jgi:hypothetical protein
VNAFAVMAAAQAAHVPLEASMFLESRSDGSWACHWWSEGVLHAVNGYLVLVLRAMLTSTQQRVACVL